MKRTVFLLAIGGFILSVTYATLGAQAKAASAGVYTADQATQGEAVYKDQCAACHGDNLEGSGPMPPLAGPDFLANWKGKTLGDLFEKTQTSMPATAPGSLTATQYANVLAFILKSNQFAAGSAALPETMDALLPITLDAPAAVAGGAPAGAAAAAPRTASAGVYTADQATQGEAVYKDQCAACHGDNLEGSGPMPPLAGPDFLANWKGKTLGDLFDKTQTSMPATAPGSLTATQYVNVIAFILKSNKFAAGATALPETMEGLLPIALDAPEGGGGAAGAAAAAPAAGGAAPHMASAGVYAADQVARGEAIYRDQCAACHGDNLEGSGPMPPLAGPDFLSNWKGKTLGDLFEKTQTTMPATAPGTLTPEQTADVLAFLLKSSNFAPGSAALVGKMEALLPITIDAPAQ